MCGRGTPLRWTKSRMPQVRQSGRGFAADTSARSFRHTSKETKLRRICSAAPIRIFIASVAAMDDAMLTAEFNTPAVSQVSIALFGALGKMQVKQALRSGRMFILAA